MTPLRAQAEQLVKELTVEPTKGSFQADADEWAAKCKTTDELVEMIYQLAKRVQEEEREACAHEADLHTGPLYSAEGNAAGKRIAAAIRQRGGQG